MKAPSLSCSTTTAPLSVVGHEREADLSAAEVWFRRTGAEGLAPEDGQWLACCREICTAALTSWGLPALTDRVRLVVSELVTNALVHAGGTMGVRIVRRAGAVRVEVADASRAQPRWDLTAGPEECNGRGMLVVRAYGDHCGVTAAGTSASKTVWCDFDLPPVVTRERR
ncbi:ATP-binding protein [Streptomyces crystallinus]|uniref:Histidine kinase/HSP90-like ATPase domain-containing protein n=1 Tax=Streptomyces crystallinus TaxID=68191 RepID=A0ABP3QEE7_9ACTN